MKDFIIFSVLFIPFYCVVFLYAQSSSPNQPAATKTQAIYNLSTNSGSNIKFNHLSVEKGLSQSAVTCILQDSKGFMWFGTKDGLNKYDGYNFTVYKYDPQDPHTISNNRILSILEDHAGTLWIGTLSGGLNELNKKTEVFRHYQYDSSDFNSLSNNNVWSILEDRSGIVWIGTEAGLNQFNRETDSFKRYLPNPGTPNSLSHDWVMSIHEDHLGDIWIGTRKGGLNQFDRETETFRHYLHDPGNPQSLSSNEVLSIHEDRSDVLWIGTSGGGLNQFDRETETFRNYQHDPKNPNSLSNNTVWSIYEDRSGVLWIGTLGGGLNQFDPSRFSRELNEEANGIFRHFQHAPENSFSLSVNDVFSIYEDTSEILWIGTQDGGLNLFDRKIETFQHFLHDPQNPSSLSDNSIRTIYEDRSEQLWIGTLSGGLSRMSRDDRNTKTFRQYQHKPRTPNSLSNNSVWSVYEDRLGNFWVGTRKGGLNLFDRKMETFKHFNPDPYKSNSLSNNWVISIYEDRSGMLWIGTWGGGLNQFDQTTKTFRHFIHDPDDPQSLSHDRVRVIYEDRSRVLWVGTLDGLNQFDRETRTFKRYKHDPNNPHSLSHSWINSIYEDRKGALWIGTSGGGLNRFDRETETFKYYRESDGLPNEVIYGILEDDRGNLWLSTNKGLSKFNPETEMFKNFDVRDGLQSNEFNGGAYFKGRNGEMYFGGINGFNVFHPNNIKDNPYIPPVVITSFYRYNTEDKEGIAIEEKGISSKDEIELSYQDNILSFEFAALNYRIPEKNQYAYKLEGFNDHWIQLGTKRDVTFTNLDPGEYTLHVKGSNNDGVWNEDGTSLKITIIPPWWKTRWAYGLYGLALIAALFALRQFELNRQHKKIRLIESEKRAKDAEEREKEKAEMLKVVEEKNDELIRTQEQLIVQEKLASLGQLTAGIAHEIQNPLNFVNNFSELSRDLLQELKEELENHKEKIDPKAFEYIEEMMDDLESNSQKINNHGKRADNIVKGMLMHSRGTSGERKLTDINALLDEYLNLSYHGIRAQDHTFNAYIEKDYDSSLKNLTAIPQELSRAFLNIFNNAFYAVREKYESIPASTNEEINLKITSSDSNNNFPAVRVYTKNFEDNVEIRIRDKGNGIPDSVRKKNLQSIFHYQACW